MRRAAQAWRAAPIAALAAVLATAVVARVRTRPPRATGSATAGATGAASSASSAPPLRGAPPRIASPGARVADDPARTLHGDPRRTHRAHGRGPRAPKVAWTQAVGGPIEAQVVVSPDAQTLYVASLDGTLTALARDGGAKRWSVALGDRAYATPCVAPDGTVYVGSDAKRFTAVAPDGRIAWRLEVDGEADTGCAITDAGLLVLAAGRTIYAVRPGGEVAWRFAAKKKVFTAPAIGDGGAIVFGSQDHHAYALSPSGALAWATDLGSDVDGAPAIADDGAIFVGTDGDEVVRLDPHGAIAWRANVGGFVRGPLSVARNGDVLAGVYGPSPRLVRLAGDTGRVVFAHAVQGTGAREFGVHGGALEDDDGNLFFGAQDDDVVAIAADGAWSWRFATGGDVDAPLTLLPSGELIAASDDGKVYVYTP